ncbi:acetoacetate decarboxylase family protein [Streptomyces sp. DSM 110735]|uniref:acetoacetate decarboxylase family protein n=1 Tax=Streptomyces sp. DSM 110735 TaxID=2775031 RepID=UPI0018F780A1|nr:acetoacetate decarboxylase family protein [Streptomyces sp. DSM 110735]MBJ7902805.1 acetoacetate decarboxylase family protein [Streptomyces sp. DSM 110735]
MPADGHAPGRPIKGGQHDDGRETAELLRRSAREVLDAAEGIRAVAARTTAALCAPAPAGPRRRRTRLSPAARAALLRALTDRWGLGAPPARDARGLARMLGAGASALGGENLAARVAVTALRLRTAALLTGHPELAREPGVRRLRRALTAHRDRDAVRALRGLFRTPDAQRSLAGLTALMTELPPVRALLDAEPADRAGDPEGGPAGGTGDAAAEGTALTGQERQTIATEGSFLGFLRNIETLSCAGRVLVQNVRGPDGVVRYVVQAPGTAPGRPRDDAPPDVLGAWQEQFTPGSPYTRALLPAIEDHGIPRGADLALIGHGEGGTALLNLAQDPEFCATYRVTHVVAVGSPPHRGKPADPRTWVARVTDEHDIVPAPEGRGGAAEAHPNRYEAEFTGTAREFPRSHTLRGYLEHLRTTAPAVRDDIDRALAPYRGPVVRTQAYRLKNRAHPPDGHPFLTLPTTSLATTRGPVSMPVRYHDSSSAHLCFPADADAVRALLPHVAWMRPSTPARRALAVLSLYEHRSSTIGPYTEIVLSVLVDDLWRPRPLDLATDLLRRADLRRTGRYVLSLAVTSEEAQVVAREIWGLPALLAPAEADLMGRHIRFTAPDIGVTVEGRLGPGVRCPEADWVLYGRRGESTVRTLVRTSGRPRLHLGAGVRLRLDTSAAEPMSGQLRKLGADGAPPLFVLSCPQSMVHRSAGAVLPR